MCMSHRLFPIPFYLAYICDCFVQYDTMVQVMLALCLPLNWLGTSYILSFGTLVFGMSPLGTQLPFCEKPTYRHLVASPRWSHSWSQHQHPTMWMSPIKLLDDCNLSLTEAGELPILAYRIMRNNEIVILSHWALKLLVRQQYVIRIHCHSMPWATISLSQTMGSPLLSSW